MFDASSLRLYSTSNYLFPFELYPLDRSVPVLWLCPRPSCLVPLHPFIPYAHLFHFAIGISTLLFHYIFPHFLPSTDVTVGPHAVTALSCSAVFHLEANDAGTRGVFLDRLFSPLTDRDHAGCRTRHTPTPTDHRRRCSPPPTPIRRVLCAECRFSTSHNMISFDHHQGNRKKNKTKRKIGSIIA